MGKLARGGFVAVVVDDRGHVTWDLDSGHMTKDMQYVICDTPNMTHDFSMYRLLGNDGHNLDVIDNQ